MLRIGAIAAAVAASVLVSVATGAGGPRTGDVTCYAVGGPPPRGEAVVARGELGTLRARIAKLVRLCRPARRGSKATARRASLTCYRLQPRRALRRSLSVENAFGRQVLAVTRADSLCFPATSGPTALELLRGPDPVRLGNAFACYAASATAFRRRSVVVSDAFRARARLTVQRPSLYCAPADVRRGKRRTPRRDTAERLVCYAAGPGAAADRRTLALNELGLFELRVGRLMTLCLASTKAAPPPSKRFTLTVVVTGMGSVQSAPAGISCPADCDESYTAGTKVILAASGPASWTGCDSTTAISCTVTMTGDRAVTAAVTHPSAAPAAQARR